MHSHADNPHTTALIVKRAFTLNDVFFLCYHLLKNRALRSLHLSFVETAGNENKSNLLMPGKAVVKKAPQILVPADRMDVTTSMFQPLSILAHNDSVECTI